jgi:hypothetical protein
MVYVKTMAMIKWWYTFSFLLTIVMIGQAQNVINLSPSIEKMLAVYEAKNKSQETIKAWRIQVAALSDRREMENEKARFENIFPYYKLEWLHDNPYYILKIKDAAFKEKLDALTLLHLIKRGYPSALVILDDVKPEKILNSTNF